MTKEHTSEEIKYRLSDLGVQIGNIAIEYITDLEHRLEQTEKELADYQFNYPTIKELQEEIATLKHNKKTVAHLSSCISDVQEKKIAELELEIKKLTQHLEPQLMTDLLKQVREEVEQEQRITELEAQIEKMKKYGKLLQDICVVLGNDNFMVAVQLESVVKKLWDTSEEKEGLKMVEDIENRLLKIKPQEWAEITKWEIKEK